MLACLYLQMQRNIPLLCPSSPVELSLSLKENKEHNNIVVVAMYRLTPGFSGETEYT